MISIPCNLCGRDDWRIRFPATTGETDELDARAVRCTSSGYGRHAQIVECRHCGFVYANPRWVDDVLLDAYTAVEDETYLQEQDGRRLTFTRHLQALEKFTGPAQGRPLLDVGAYIGVFVEVALKAGWQATGIEPSRWAVEVAQGQSLPVIQGTLTHPELPEDHFEVVTMWDVIEHVADPSAELARAYHLLAPGGWLVVHTMDIDSLMARLMGRRWPWLMDMHIHYFSQRTLNEMLRQQGFQIVWHGAQGRYLSLGYLADRVAGLNRTAGRLLGSLIKRLGWQTKAIPVNFGDLFTVYARRPVK